MTHFVLIGAGGLGGPIAYALAAAGDCTLTIVDDDVVDLSNLQRQIQFATADVGAPKVDALARELARRGVAAGRVRPVRARFDASTAAELLARADVVVDGSDNFATKFAVNDACAAAGLPFAIGGVLRYTGQVLAAAPPESGCYRCVFEAPPPDADADSCADAGVLGAAVAVVAGACARTALALAAGDRSDAGSLLVFDDLSRGARARRVSFRRRPGCPACTPAGRSAAPEAP
ncbi:MAG: HesA/MoeB/ThiF family protein [Deltaproteobacteria bacterium]|nr:MAG: HesA/MoeB/ThiF family protein [Deltaproteobacteria bacterium]